MSERVNTEFERAKVRGWAKYPERCRHSIVAQVKVKNEAGIHLSVWRAKAPQVLTIDLDDLEAFRLGGRGQERPCDPTPQERVGDGSG